MNPIILKNKFNKGELTKADYIDKMHNFHKYFFIYSQFLKKTDIAKIEITDNQVIVTTKEKGVKLIADKDDKRAIPFEILNFDYYEKDCLKMIKKLVKGNWVIFDIGANIGWYSLVLAKEFPKMKIFAFEPIPETYRYLRMNIKLNKLAQVKAYKFGFYHQKGKVDFYYYKEGSGNASLQNLSQTKDVRKISCDVKKIDDFIKEKGINVDFVKCDVEGAELFVIKGGLNSIDKQKPIILAEMLRKWSAFFGYDPNEIIKLLAVLGYNCYVVKRNKLKRFFLMDDKTLETNFFFLHKIKHQAMIKQNCC